jgi:hypothetical protein
MVLYRLSSSEPKTLEVSSGWINLARSRTGHLFQGRYKALLLDADAYLLEFIRYVHLNPNPVRAGIVTVVLDVQDYRVRK